MSTIDRLAQKFSDALMGRGLVRSSPQDRIESAQRTLRESAPDEAISATELADKVEKAMRRHLGARLRTSVFVLAAVAVLVILGVVCLFGKFGKPVIIVEQTPTPTTLPPTEVPPTEPASADLVINEESYPNTANPGEVLTYTLTYTNNGPSDAQDVFITDTLPSQVTFGGVVSMAPSLFGPTVPPHLAWHTSTLQRNTGDTIVFTVTVDTDASNTLTNTANINAATSDPALDNNECSETTSIINLPLAIGKAASLSTTAMVGEIEYQIVVTNTSSQSHNNVNITDPAPTHIVPVTGTVICSPDAVCVGSSEQVTASIDSLSPQTVLTLTFRATIDQDTQIEDIINKAYVTSDEQSAPSESIHTLPFNADTASSPALQDLVYSDTPGDR